MQKTHLATRNHMRFALLRKITVAEQLASVLASLACNTALPKLSPSSRNEADLSLWLQESI